MLKREDIIEWIPWANGVLVGTVFIGAAVFIGDVTPSKLLSPEGRTFLALVSGVSLIAMFGVSPVVIASIRRKQWAKRLLVVLAILWVAAAMAAAEPIAFFFDEWHVDSKKLFWIALPLIIVWGEVYVLGGVDE